MKVEFKDDEECLAEIRGEKMRTKLQSPVLISVLATLMTLAMVFAPFGANAGGCLEMEQEGLLLFQQFKRNKMCKDSDIGKGWTDCQFKAGATEILLVGAIGRTFQERMLGWIGSGFYILSVDPSVRVRVFADENLGLIVRVEGKGNLEETGCVYNEAYITLDARVLSPGELHEIKSGFFQPRHSKTEKERIREVQEDLLFLGYRTGPIDGVLGRKTRNAVEGFKRDKNLQPAMPDEEVFKLIALEAAFKRLQNEMQIIWGPRQKY